ncbi:hypothetical protein IIA15_10355 [candidate division TA06 bacterium]|nr:hypothetical protein [candidate division TA06 bacterium]
MVKTLRWFCIWTIMSLLICGQSIVADGKPKGSKGNAVKGKDTSLEVKVSILPREIPPDFSKEEVKEWKKGRPPGWSHGRKVGWKGGNMPPGQAKKYNLYPPGWKTWDKKKRNAWENELKIAIKVVLGKAKRVKIYTKAEIDIILFSLEMTARKGVPIKSARSFVEKSVKKKMKVGGIETTTRAMTFGVGKGINYKHLDKSVHKKLDKGLKDDELAIGIYKEIAKHHEENLKFKKNSQSRKEVVKE